VGAGVGDGVGVVATGASVLPEPPPQAAMSAAMPSRALALRSAIVGASFMIRLLSTLAFRVMASTQE
jgi:hypothetical protein